MGDDFLIIATGIHQGIGKNRHPVEGSFGVDGVHQIGHVGREPTRVDGDLVEGVAEVVAEEVRLRRCFAGDVGSLCRCQRFECDALGKLVLMTTSGDGVRGATQRL